MMEIGAASSTRLMQVVFIALFFATLQIILFSNLRNPGGSSSGSSSSWSSINFNCTNAATKIPASNANAFDSVMQSSYNEAFADAVHPTRNVLDLSTWKKGTGGLTDPDRILLAEIYGNACSVFEFGLGESTFIANHVGVPRYAGIDSDPVWVSQARELVQPHFRFYFGDIGPTRNWGYPADGGLQKSLLNYQVAPLIVEPEAFDVYMVDGRLRFGCMMASFLHASHHGADTSHTTVLLHDCGATRAAEIKLGSNGRLIYHEADALLDLVNHSGNKLCVYRRKPNTTDSQLLELWHKHHHAWQR